MSALEVVVAHQERVTIRVADAFVKVDAQDWRIEREVQALALAPVPRPAVLWRKPNVVALRPLAGRELARLGEPSTASRGAWRAAGATARVLHAAPPPPWHGWDEREFASFLDGECRWLVDGGHLPVAVVERVRQRAERALRPFTPVFTHGDLQAAHVFVAGDAVIGVIDWADACPGDAWFDLAVLTVGHPEHLDDVVTGYGDDVDVEVVHGWWALRKIGTARWMIEHGFDASGDLAEIHRTAST